MRKATAFLLLLLVAPLFAFGDNLKPEKKVAYAVYCKDKAPRIDGKLDDPAWQTAPFQDTFIQLNPVEGNSPSERTAFKVLYDAQNIYFGIINYDHNPKRIAARVSRRDEVENSDFIVVGLDTYFDHRTAFAFGLSAGGVKTDLVISQDGERMDDSWDPVWDGQVSITDSGWVAEMRIPYNQLRFARKQEQVWGFQIFRKIYRKQEEDFWQFIPKNAPGLVSYFGELRGIRGIKPPKRIELLPYTVTEVKRYQKEAGNPFATGSDFNLNAGLDGKIGISGDLTLDFTVNPDFGQVEADPSDVNLTAFETYFEEKRPFFIEGKSIFNFPLAMGDGDMSTETLFYSRRIGRAPHYYPSSKDGFNFDYADVPEQTPIWGAAKLSGKTRNGWSIGILNALTGLTKAAIDSAGQRRQVTIEPLTNYFVNRLQKDFNQGNTSFGGIVTATNRRITDVHLRFLNKSAYTGGIDVRHQWDHKTYFLDFKLAGSYLSGDPQAIELVQRSSARYFQRPDARHVHLDTTRRSLAGYGGSFSIGRVGNSNWRLAGGGLWRSPGFETNDLGYMRKADQVIPYVWVGYRINNPVGIFRSVSINSNVWQMWNFGGENLATGGNLNGGAQFLNYWGFYLGVNREQPGLSPWMLRGGPMARYEGNWNFWINTYSDSRKAWRIRLSGGVNVNDDKISNSKSLNVSFYVRLSDRVNVRVRPFYNHNVENLQYITTLDYAGQKRYIFGELNQKTLGLVFRFNYSPTPNLSIQYYGQPFVSAGAYRAFKRITAPRAKGSLRYQQFTGSEIRYDQDEQSYYVDEDRNGAVDYSFGRPDFNFKQFRSNLVVRWEYRPGSTLFLVWSQSRTGFDSTGEFDYAKNMWQLFNVWPENVFLVKLNYWFSM